MYKKQYTDGNHARLQAEAQKDIQQSFMNAEKMMNIPTDGEVTIAFTNNVEHLTLTVTITAPLKLMRAFSRIFKKWKEHKFLRINNTISRRRYNTHRGMMESESTLGPHNRKVNRYSNVEPSFYGEVSEYRDFKNGGRGEFTIGNMAKFHGSKKAPRNSHHRIYNSNSAHRFATFQALAHNGNTAAISAFVKTISHEDYERLVERYTIEEMQNAHRENPSIHPDELMQVGIDAFMFAGMPNFVENTPKSEKERRIDLLHRAAMHTVPILIEQTRGLRSR